MFSHWHTTNKSGGSRNESKALAWKTEWSCHLLLRGTGGAQSMCGRGNQGFGFECVKMMHLI